MSMKKLISCLVLAVALGGAALLYFRIQNDKPEPQAQQQPAAPPEPPIRHPIEAATPEAEPLPALAESDGAVREALAELFGSSLEDFFNPQDIVQRFVATVDNLPRENVAQRLMPVKPVAGRLAIAGKGESLTLSSENAARYEPYVRLAESVPTGPLVATYVQFYPLFQQQYEELGYPDKYFNDRLVEVIDHLLAAPEVQEPVALTQPKVLYEFADPKLQELSAGQKILVRMGGANAARVKAKLHEIRSAVARNAPQR
jgi:hypothetical protein